MSDGGGATQLSDIIERAEAAMKWYPRYANTLLVPELIAGLKAAREEIERLRRLETDGYADTDECPEPLNYNALDRSSDDYYGMGR